MNRFLISTVMAFAIVTIAPKVWAQTQISAQVRHIVEMLDLTSSQDALVTPILTQAAMDRIAILKDAGIDRNEKPSMFQLLKVRGPIRDARAVTERKLSAVLSAEQMSKYRKIVNDIRQKVRARLQ